MVRTPQNLEDAKTLFREEKAKLTGSLSAIAGSRWLTAILATFAIAFGANAIYGPTQLPSVGGFSLTTIGLPPNLDFGVVGEQAGQALDAAQRQGAPSEVAVFLAENAGLIPVLNWVGLGLTLALLLGNMWIMTVRRPYSRG
jgi:hypothetical protein